jgi:hypothetical protein
MAQFGRPEADITAWASGTFADIDESVASDAEYVSSDTAPSNDPAYYRLSDMEDPVSSTGHIIRYRYRKNAAGGAQIDLTVQLRQDYVNEGSPGTLIEEWTHTDISETFTTAAQTLGATEADSITDYTTLGLRFVANQV